MGNNRIEDTMNISIIIQFITLIINIYVLVLPVTGIAVLLRQLLFFEFVVQIIEMLFYVWMSSNLSIIKNITSVRYYDWAITTPTMLITLIVYLIYIKLINNVDDNVSGYDNGNNNGYDNDNDNKTYDIWNIINNNKNNILIIMILNWIMLLFGYLGEIKYISINSAVFLGFIPFIIYFFIIYNDYAKYTSDGLQIYFYFFIVWCVYGLLALLPYKPKNISYNILDLISKNFFGLYLSYKLFFQ